MIERKGSMLCENCGREFTWIARKMEEKQVAVIGRIANIDSKNIAFFDNINGYLKAIAKCEYCGHKPMKYVVDEKL